MRTVIKTVIKDTNEIFGMLETKLEELNTLVFEVKQLTRELKDMFPSGYTLEFDKAVKLLDRTTDSVVVEGESLMGMVGDDIAEKTLILADSYWRDVVCTINDERKDFFLSLGDKESFKNWVLENDRIAFDNEESADVFWAFINGEELDD